jgi:hypothetical protein
MLDASRRGPDHELVFRMAHNTWARLEEAFDPDYLEEVMRATDNRGSSRMRSGWHNPR